MYSNIAEVKIAEMTLFEHGSECVCSYTICVVLAAIALAIITVVGAYFIYFHWYLKKDVIRVKFGTHTETTI